MADSNDQAAEQARREQILAEERERNRREYEAVAAEDLKARVKKGWDR